MTFYLASKMLSPHGTEKEIFFYKDGKMIKSPRSRDLNKS